MTEYVCKYAPIELLAGFGEESALFNLPVQSFDRADTIMHRNVCGFSRALIESRMEHCGGGLILTDCCDSIRRSCDVLSGQGRKIFMLDLPHGDGVCAVRLYQKELMRFLAEFSAYSGREFDLAKFKGACGTRPEAVTGPSVVLLGARMSDELAAYITCASPLLVANRLCTGARRIDRAPGTEDTGALMEWYAGQLLSQPPCMRMSDITARRALSLEPGIRAVIYNTVSFCDYYAFEYARLVQELDLPILKIETDYTRQSAAQLKNRLDAFFETLGAPETKPGPPVKQAAGNKAGRYFAGIDSGSTTTNAVILDGEKRMVSFAVLPTGVSVADSAKEAFGQALSKAKLSETQIGRTVTTGYGRAGIGFGGREVTEITCHAKGARFLNPRVRTVIDIGGQDSKIIRLDESGAVKDFAMNDKCAAGTGRFLEMMAQSLGVTLEHMSVCGLEWDEEVAISSMCSVFAQSEVVSLIAHGKKLPDIVRGLNLSVASKVIALGGRTAMEGEYMMTGGVAKNAGVVRAVEEKLGCPVSLPDEPELCGALGAALIAWEDGAGR